MCASTAYVKNNLVNYLSLSGGTITGRVFFSYGDASIAKTSTDDALYVGGGTSWDAGAHLVLNGKDKDGGLFILASHDGTNYNSLVGRNDGSLTWGGVSVLNPVGTVIAFAANSAPSGYLLCNGAAVSRTTYARLFSVIGTTYGEGDGSTTFNLPNLTDRFIQGSSTAGTVKSAGVPEVWGALSSSNLFAWADYLATSGVFEINKGKVNFVAGSASQTAVGYLDFHASRCSSVYGTSDTVQPPALTMRYYIKY